MQNYKNYKKKTNLKADDEEVMVISRRFIRSIWEAAAILLAVIIAPLRELFHSPNFNHHPTLTLPFHHPGNLSIIFQLLLHHHHHHHHHHNPTLTSPFSSSLSSTSSLHHHPTLISQFSSSRSSLQHHPAPIILDNSHCTQFCLLVFIFAFLLCAASLSCERQICTMNREIFVTLVTRYKWPALEKRNILPSVKAL